MQPINPLAHCLQEFLAGRTVTRSSLGTRARTALQPLFDAQALSEKRSGGGWIICPDNAKAIEHFARDHFPSGLLHDGSPMSRAEAVALLGNAKRGKNLTGEPLLIRAFSDIPLSGNGKEIDIQTWTQQCGVASILLTDDNKWTYPAQHIATVENLEPFLQFEQRFSGYDAAIYGAGRMSERLLTWLAKNTFKITHFGDYDPVGLSEFLRMKTRCGNRAKLYIPEQLSTLLASSYGKPELMRDSSTLLPRLRQFDDKQVQFVLQEIEEVASGLEQEKLW